MKVRSATSMSLSEVCDEFSEYRLRRSTLEVWIELGVFFIIYEQEFNEKNRGKGRAIKKVPLDQITRLERFLHYRQWFPRSNNNEKSQIDEIVVLLNAIDNEQWTIVEEYLEEIKEDLSSKIGSLKAELQWLHSKKTGDPEVDPEDVEDLGSPED